MKKIDLHIHTKSSSQDREFSFSKEVLQRYVSEAELSCIAITNHNLFDKNQFSEIKSALEILVLPGIEVDVEKCHILVLADGRDLDDFSQKCEEVERRWRASGVPLQYAGFVEVFGDLRKYILIPHYLKEPSPCKSLKGTFTAVKSVALRNLWRAATTLKCSRRFFLVTAE